MAGNPLNYFQPYESLPAGHENQLTRALVVVLRLSPMAHAVWLRRVDAALVLHELPAVDWRVQRRDIVPGGPPADFDGLRVISVFLSGERADAGGAVEASDRGQVLDAVALYGTELAIVVENKITGEPRDWQARSLNLGGFNLRLDQHPVRIPWRVVLGDLTELLNRELISGAEAGVVEDFLEYAEAHFDALLPFNTLAVCHGSPQRQRRRLRMILTEASGIEARPDRRPNIPLPGVTTVQMAYLEINDDEVQLRLFPADTLTQAKALYTRPAAVAGLRRLRRAEWLLTPGFHWGHLAKGLAGMPTPMDVDDYIDLWVDQIQATHQVRREGWDEYWDWLIEHEVVAPQARDEFRIHFDDTERQSATPRPGLRIRRAWPLAEAERLDDVRGRFAAAVRDALDEILSALQETLTPSAISP